jgi:hypothetical protein
VRSVDVRLDLRMLSGGLVLVDTPGVGGLESAHGEVALAALASTEAAIFVTDASQELTAPEVAFLKQALKRCPSAVCVVSKIDLYPQWRRIAELDEQHLRRAGIDLPVIPVSSFLRQRARDEEPPERTRLNTESNFKPLYDWLAQEVLASADRRAAAAAAADVEFATRQLRTEVETERLVLTEPDRADEIVEQLDQDRERSRALATAGASWQQALGFGIEDLVADVQHDLAERVKKILREAEGVIDETDPKETWDTVGAWLQKQVVAAAAANHDLLRDRAEALAGDVADAFALEAGSALRSTAPGGVSEVAGIEVGALDDSALKQGRATRIVIVGRTAALVPMMTFAIAPHLALMGVLGPLGIAAGAWVGGKMIKDERARQLTYRRQLAKAAVRRYLDDVQFVLNKECRDALAATRRELLVEFQARAEVLQVSAQRAYVAARRAAGTPPEEQAERVAAVERQAAVLAAAGGRVP